MLSVGVTPHFSPLPILHSDRAKQDREVTTKLELATRPRSTCSAQGDQRPLSSRSTTSDWSVSGTGARLKQGWEVPAHLLSGPGEAAELSRPGQPMADLRSEASTARGSGRTSGSGATSTTAASYVSRVTLEKMLEEQRAALYATPLHRPLTTFPRGRLPFIYGRSLHGLMPGHGPDLRA